MMDNANLALVSNHYHMGIHIKVVVEAENCTPELAKIIKLAYAEMCAKVNPEISLCILKKNADTLAEASASAATDGIQ